MKNLLTISFFVFSFYFLRAQEPKLVLPVGHRASFGNLYLSYNGNLAATTAFKDKMVAVWDTRTGKLLSTFNDTLAFWGFRKISFTRDGKKLLAEGGSGMIWDIEKKKLIADLHIGDGFEESSIPAFYSLSPDGETLAYTNDTIISVIALSTKKIIYSFNDHLKKITSLNYSPDGKWLALNTDKRTIIHQLQNNGTGFSIEAAGTTFFSADSKKITGWRNNELVIYALETGEKLHTIPCSQPETIWLSPDNKKMLAILAELKKNEVYRKALLIDMDKELPVYQWEDIVSARFHPDNESIVLIKETRSPSANEYTDYTTHSKVEIWNSNTARLLKSWSDSLPLTINDEGNKIAAATESNIIIANAKTGTVVQEWNWHGHIPDYAISISPDGKRVLTSSNYINCWDSETGTILGSAFISKEENDFGNEINIIYAHDSSKFIATKKSKWQLWNAKDARILAESTYNLNGTVLAAFSKNDQQAAFLYQNPKQTYLDIYDLRLLKNTKRFLMSREPVQAIDFSPDAAGLIISYEEKDVTEIRSVNNFSLLKKMEGSVFGGFSADGTKMITTRNDFSSSNIWDYPSGRLLFHPDGKLVFSPLENKVLSTTGYTWDMKDEKTNQPLQNFDEFGSLVFNFFKGPPDEFHFSPDGKKIIGIIVSAGSAGEFPSVYVWDVKTGGLIQSPDTSFAYNDFVSVTGKKIVQVPVNEDEDMKIIDIENKDTVWLSGSRDADRATFAVFTPDDKYLFTSNDQTIKKWELATGRLLFTFFPVDSTACLTRIPSGYYSCSPDAARSLHYVRGMQVINFNQCDVRYNRPDRVLEYINYPDTLLTAAYRKAWLKRIKKLNMDTAFFDGNYSVPEADIINRDKIEDEQKEEPLTLHISGVDSSLPLERFNIWINEVPLFGLKGVNILRRHSLQFDTTVTVMLSQGSNRIETSVTNTNGIESYRSLLQVSYSPSKEKRKTEKIHFIGIGINNFADSNYNLSWSVKDIRDLALSFKKKYGNTCSIDTLFNERVTRENIKALKSSLFSSGINDKIIISYSGHGMLSKDFDYYLSTYAIRFENPQENGLPYEDLENLLDSIPARKKLLLIDACHSGEVDKEDLIALKNIPDNLLLKKGLKPVAYKMEGHLGLKNSFELMQSLFINVGKSTGATIISAAAGTQFALERNDLKNGVFTYSILESMKKYPSLKISALKKIVGERVEQLTNGMQRPTSRNEMIAVDWTIW